jgi:DNA gyrase subunit B
VFDDRAAGTVDTFHAPQGVTGLAAELGGADIVGVPLLLQGSGTYDELVQVPTRGDDGLEKLVPTQLTRTADVTVAFRWRQDEPYHLRSFVNIVETPKGGTHVTGFERALVRSIQGAFDGTKLLKAGEDVPIKEDILSGLSAVVVIRLPEPLFDGQTKDALSTGQAAKLVQEIVSEQLGIWLKTPKNKTAARAILERTVSAARARLAAKRARELIRRKSALQSSGLPDKLKDCHSNDVERTELFIIEGDSAAGTVGAARNSDTQAYLPVRGKVLNVFKAGEDKMLANAECQSLVQAIGGGSGASFSLDAARYGKVCVLADADQDGAHIKTLLVAFFWTYMRPLVEAGRVYVAVPPLYRIRVKGSGDEIYCFTDRHRDQVLAELTAQGRSWHDDIQRFKGLGEMGADQLAVTTLDPSSRLLRRLTVDDAAAAAEMLDICMGENVARRQEFIAGRSNDFSLEELAL